MGRTRGQQRLVGGLLNVLDVVGYLHFISNKHVNAMAEGF